MGPGSIEAANPRTQRGGGGDYTARGDYRAEAVTYSRQARCGHKTYRNSLGTTTQVKEAKSRKIGISSPYIMLQRGADPGALLPILWYTTFIAFREIKP